MSSLKLKRYLLETENIIPPNKNKYEAKNFKHKCNFCNIRAAEEILIKMHLQSGISSNLISKEVS